MSVPVVDDTWLAALRADFADAGFTFDAVVDFLGEDGALAWQQDRRVPLLHRCQQAEKTPLSALIRFFILGQSLSATTLAAALPRTQVAGLVALGLAQLVGEHLRPLVHLAPHAATIGGAEHHWWVASDLGALAGARPAPDHVLGVGGATRTLALATPPAPVDSALDLGTGCGVLALYLATHAKRVVATDISARACAFARFNAALNGVAVQVRQGDLCGPVAGETFDLIVSNPPFVITAAAARAGGVLEYRDGNMEGDALTATVVGQVCDHLAAGGHAVVMGNWEVESAPAAPQPADIPAWANHVQRWLAGRDVAAWVVQRRQLSPAEYVRLWSQDSSAGQGTGAESTELAWLEDFSARGVDSIGMGMVVLAAPSTSEHRGRFHPARCFEAIETSSSAAGEYLQSVVDVLASGWEVSGADTLVRAEDVREERHYLPGYADPQLVIATQGGGFGQRLRLSSEGAGFLGACDGELTVGQIVAAIAVLTDAPAEDVWAGLRAPVEQLLRAGMVWPVHRS